MAMFERSKAEDGIDRYNHIWSLVLLLILSLITWLLPLSSLQSSSNHSGGNGIPKVMTSCHMLQSEHGVLICTDAVKSLLTPTPVADMLNQTDDVIVKLHTANPTEPIDMDSPDPEIIQLQVRHMIKREVRSNLEDIITTKTPLLLFVVAIFLIVPKVIHVLMSICGGLNIDRVLSMASKRKNHDHESWKYLKAELSQSLRERGVSRLAALSYLLMKFLAIASAAGGVVIVLVFLYSNLDYLLKMVEETRAGTDTTENLACQYAVYEKEMRTFVNQCVFTVSWDLNTLTTLAGIYMPLLLGLTIYLIGLLALNVVSFLTWIVSLTAQPCRENMTCEKTSMDDYLLLRMSQINAGPMVTHELAVSLAGKGVV